MLNPKEFEKRVADARKAGRRSEIVNGDGLYLNVTATGAATWRYRYRVNGRREKITIGPLAEIGLAEARKRKMIIAGQAALASHAESIPSPAQRREKDKQTERVAKLAGTIGELGTKYLAHLRARGRKANSVDWHINAYIIPELGSTKTPELTQAQIKRLCDKIKAKAPASARSVLGTIKQMMKFAKSEELIDVNPAADMNPISLAPKLSRERSLSSDELRAFLVGCDNSGMRHPCLCCAEIDLAHALPKKRDRQGTMDGSRPRRRHVGNPRRAHKEREGPHDSSAPSGNSHPEHDQAGSR